MYNRKQMFQAVCDKCGNSCEVPFQPTGGKPVLCSDCFGHQGKRHQNRSGDRHNRSDRSGDRRMHQAVCDKCGNKCEVPFRPTAGKPIYCNDCFSKSSDRDDRRGGRERHGGRERRGGGGNDQLSQQLKSLNSKLDRVLIMLDSGAPTKSTPKKPATKKSAKGGSQPKADQPLAGAKISGGKAAKKKK